MTSSNSSNTPLLTTKPTKMSFVDQELSNDVFNSIVRPLQQKLGSRLTKLTVFATTGRHDRALSDDLCVFVCVLLRYAFSQTVPIAELSKRTVQSAFCRSGDTQSGRACGCSFGIQSSCARGCLQLLHRDSVANPTKKNKGQPDTSTRTEQQSCAEIRITVRLSGILIVASPSRS